MAVVRKKSLRRQVAVVAEVFGRAILGVHEPLGCLAEGAPAFDPDSVPRASGFSSAARFEVPVAERSGG